MVADKKSLTTAPPVSLKQQQQKTVAPAKHVIEHNEGSLVYGSTTPYCKNA
jgi:hypothetical protein